MVRLLYLLLVLPMLLLVGFLYQRLGAMRDRRRYLRQGRVIDIGGGCRIYLSEMGSGGPAVIFESGIATSSQNWLRMQQAVSGFTRTVSYDRGGLGWSSPGGSDRTPANIVQELRRLLQLAGVPPPYVLVGHSFGGLCVRRFATDHPEDVVGVVLVDGMRTEEWPPNDDAQKGMLDNCARLTYVAVWMSRSGVSRLITRSLFCRSGALSRTFSRACGPRGMHVLDRVSCEIGKMPAEIRPIVASHWSGAGFYRGLRAHLNAVPRSVKEADATAPIPGGVPVLVLTAGSASPLAVGELWRIGLDARQVIARESGHWIHLDEPDLVLEAIRDMVEAARAPVAESVELLRF